MASDNTPEKYQHYTLRERAAFLIDYKQAFNRPSLLDRLEVPLTVLNEWEQHRATNDDFEQIYQAELKSRLPVQRTAEELSDELFRKTLERMIDTMPYVDDMKMMLEIAEVFSQVTLMNSELTRRQKERAEKVAKKLKIDAKN